MSVPAYVDIERLCAELCICPRTVDAWVRQGILPAPRQRGGKRLWKWAEVEQSLDAGSPSVQPLADPEAERIRRYVEETAAKDNGRDVRHRDQGLSGKPDVRRARA